MFVIYIAQHNTEEKTYVIQQSDECHIKKTLKSIQ